jgi:hypothetical protein
LSVETKNIEKEKGKILWGHDFISAVIPVLQCYWCFVYKGIPFLRKKNRWLPGGR